MKALKISKEDFFFALNIPYEIYREFGDTFVEYLDPTTGKISCFIEDDSDVRKAWGEAALKENRKERMRVKSFPDRYIKIVDSYIITESSTWRSEEEERSLFEEYLKGKGINTVWV